MQFPDKKETSKPGLTTPVNRQEKDPDELVHEQAPDTENSMEEKDMDELVHEHGVGTENGFDEIDPDDIVHGEDDVEVGGEG